MAGKHGKKNAKGDVIVKKYEIVEGGHHGGAWKVAYADFVTAMMAFFLLMWLINTTSPEQKRGIADYFAPAAVSETTSGSGGILGGPALPQTRSRGGRRQGRDPGAGARCAAERRRERPEPERRQPAAAERRGEERGRRVHQRRPVTASGDAGHARAGGALQADHRRPDARGPARPAGRPG